LARSRGGGGVGDGGGGGGVGGGELGGGGMDDELGVERVSKMRSAKSISGHLADSMAAALESADN